MKNLYVLAVAALLFLLSCQDDNLKKSEITLSEIQSVEAAVEDFKTGMINADKDLLDGITAEQLIYGHSRGKVQNKSEFIDEVVSLLPNDYQKIDLSDQTILVSGETAVVRHIYSAEYLSNGVSGNLKIGNVMIWQKQMGRWKLLARQAYTL
jgi:ketosteroid isomerase-like protein